MVEEVAVGQDFPRGHKFFIVSIFCHCSKMQGGAEVTWHILTLGCQMTFAPTVILERLVWNDLHRV